jgi:soluble epoxide hydrolase/lipid-phosphate phosphatase
MHHKIFAGNYGPALNWYRTMMQNLNVEEQEKANLDPKLNIQALMIAGKHDVVSRPDLALEGMNAYVSKFRFEVVESGHWPQLEQRDEVNGLLKEFWSSL